MAEARADPALANNATLTRIDPMRLRHVGFLIATLRAADNIVSLNGDGVPQNRRQG